MPQHTVRVYYDVREEASGVPGLLKRLGVLAIGKQLPNGDYIIPEDHVIERKSARDFVASLFDGRLFDQARRLSNSYSYVYYLIEGDFQNELRYWFTRRKQLVGALVSLVVDFDVRLLWSSDAEESAIIIERLASRLLEGRHSGSVVIMKKKSLNSIRDWQLYVLQSFPGIGAKTAERLLERFGSIEGFIRASVTELASVEGVGEVKAHRIKELLKATYQASDNSRGQVKTLDSFAAEGAQSQRALRAKDGQG